MSQNRNQRINQIEMQVWSLQIVKSNVSAEVSVGNNKLTIGSLKYKRRVLEIKGRDLYEESEGN